MEPLTPVSSLLPLPVAFAGHLKDAHFPSPLGQSVSVAAGGLEPPVLLEVSWLSLKLLGLAASASTCGPVGHCCTGGFRKVRRRGSSRCSAASWVRVCKARAAGCQGILCVCVCLLWCHSLFGGRSAEVPAPGCKGAGSTVWEWGAHAYVMEMVQTQEHEAVLWLVTRQHCRSSPFGSLGSFRAQEDAYLCWGDPSCGEEGSK